MAYADIKRRLDAGEVLLLDGGVGTELERRGADMDPAAWCGVATLANEELLTQIHIDYARAGSDVITANTFASSRVMLGAAGHGDDVVEINQRAVEAALRAKEQKLFILDSFQLGEIKTQKAIAALEKLGIENALIVDASDNQVLAKSVRNLDNYTFLPPEGLNLFDLL
jgi:methionine synthase I (cobalamin-dependent)